MMLNKNSLLFAFIGWGSLLFAVVVKILFFSVDNTFIQTINPNIGITSVVFFIISAIFLGISTYLSYSLIDNKPFLNKSLIIIFVLLVFVAIPFNTHDISYYFAVAKNSFNGLNVFNQNWYMINYFSESQKSLIIEGFAYGPLMIYLFGAAFLLANKSFLVFIIIWKFIMLASVVCLYYQIKYIFNKLFDLKIDSFILFFVLQAFLLWETIGNGHFDTIWLNLVFFSIIFAIKNRWIIVFPLLVVAVWIKFIPLLMAPWFLLWWWQTVDMGNYKKRFFQLIVAGLISFFVTVVSWYQFWSGFDVFNSIVMQSKWAVQSLFSLLYYSIKFLLWNFIAGNYHWYITRFVHLVLFIIALYFIMPLLNSVYRIITKKEKGSSIDFVRYIFVSMLIYLSIWQKSFWPWYVAWLIPFGITLWLVTKNIFLRKILLWMSIVPFLFYVILLFFLNFIHIDIFGQLWFNLVWTFCMWGYPLYYLFKWRKTNYKIS